MLSGKPFYSLFQYVTDTSSIFPPSKANNVCNILMIIESAVAISHELAFLWERPLSFAPDPVFVFYTTYSCFQLNLLCKHNGSVSFYFHTLNVHELLTFKRCKNEIHLYPLKRFVLLYFERFEGCILLRVVKPCLKWCIYNKNGDEEF